MSIDIPDKRRLAVLHQPSNVAFSYKTADLITK